jgi:NitT/TauT family transport system substrate-binding protein
MMSRKMRILTLLLASSVALLGTGCGTASGAGSGAGNSGTPVLPKVAGLEKTTINAAISPVVDSAGFFIALRAGLFAQEGLTVNYSPAHGDTVIGDMVKGKYDITATNYVSYIQAQDSGQANLRVIAEGSLLQPGNRVIMALPDSGIKSLADLRNRVLGVNDDPNIGFLLAASVLAENGIPVTAGTARAVRFPSFSMPYPDAAPALVSKKVAAAVMSEPFVTQAAENYGAVTIADLDAGATQQFPMEGYAVTKAWATANPNTLRAFQIALEAGQRIADTDRAAVEAAYVALPADAGHIDQLTAATMALDTYPLSIDAVRLQRVPDVMQQFGFLKQYFDIRRLLK